MMTMESVREWAWWAGQEPRFRDQQWLLHDYDVWIENPHYTGPEQRHPEDYTNEMEDAYYNTHFSDGTPVSVYDDGNWGRNK